VVDDATQFTDKPTLAAADIERVGGPGGDRGE
jgi:hypothetical protein